MARSIESSATSGKTSLSASTAATRSQTEVLPRSAKSAVRRIRSSTETSSKKNSTWSVPERDCTCQLGRPILSVVRCQTAEA